MAETLVTVFTDGACPSNGRGGGVGGVGVFWGDNHADNVSQCFTSKTLGGGKTITNNVMELMAIRRAVDAFIKNYSGTPTRLVLYTDSMYCVKVLTVWAQGWERNGWKKGDNKTPENLELIRSLFHDVQTRPLTLRHCYSHGKPPPKRDSMEYTIWYGNHMADYLASSACRGE